MATIVTREGKTGEKHYVVYYFNGKQHWKCAGTKKGDAKRLKSHIESSIHKGVHCEPGNKTFEELAEKWLAKKETEIRKRTYASYKPCVKRLIDYFGGMKLKRISPEDAEDFAIKLSKEKISSAT